MERRFGPLGRLGLINRHEAPDPTPYQKSAEDETESDDDEEECDYQSDYAHQGDYDLNEQMAKQVQKGYPH
jgi:hypothetical protein